MDDVNRTAIIVVTGLLIGCLISCVIDLNNRVSDLEITCKTKKNNYNKI